MQAKVEIENKLYKKIHELIINSKQSVLRQINTTIVSTYFEIGRMIYKNQQKEAPRALYGSKLIKTLSASLTKEFGNGFSKRNLENMRSFFITYSQRKPQTVRSITQTLSAQSGKEVDNFQLSWSHYVFLIRLQEPTRRFYEIESIKNNWSLRELKRQFNTALFERLAANKSKKLVVELSAKGQLIDKPTDIVKDPYILEFLGLKDNKSYSENDLETKIINNLEQFLLELGKGFSFVSRQQRISFDEQHFYIDLVFYHRILKCFVLFDLKIGELKHQDLGQLQMYVNYYDRKIKMLEENRTIGILLCADKNDTVVKMTLPENNKYLFASKYKLYLPTRTELLRQVRETK